MRSLCAEAGFPEYDIAQDQTSRERIKTVITIDNKPIYDHTQGDGIVVKDKKMQLKRIGPSIGVVKRKQRGKRQERTANALQREV